MGTSDLKPVLELSTSNNLDFQLASHVLGERVVISHLLPAGQKHM